MTRYLPNRDALIAGHGRDAEIAELCGYLRQGDWNTILTRYRAMDPDILAKDALKAFSQGDIKVETFCTLAYTAALLKEFPGVDIEVHPLFTNGDIDPEAREIIQESLRSKATWDSNFFTPSEAQEVLDGFIENMRRKDLSEQFYFTVPFHARGGEGFGDLSIRQILDSLIGLRLFDHFNDGITGDFLMVPSFTMTQAAVDAYRPDNGKITAWPTIGASTRADLRENIAGNGRDFFVPFPGVARPARADGFRVEDSCEFRFHDFYHLLTCKAVPDALRQETGRLADMVATLQAQYADAPDDFFMPFLETVYGRMIDMDFNLPRAGWLEDLQQSQRIGTLNVDEGGRFLIELENQLVSVTAFRMMLKLNTLPPKDQRDGLSASTLKSLEKWDRLKEKIDSGDSFDTTFKEFCEEHAGFKILTQAIYKSGLLSRLGIENIQPVQDASRRVRMDDPNLLPLPALAGISPFTDYLTTITAKKQE